MSLFSLDDTKYPFMKMARYLVPLSVISIILCLAILGMRGLNFGIDFRGGTLILIETQAEIGIPEIRTAMDELTAGDVSVTSISGAPEGREQSQIRIGNNGEATVSVEDLNRISAALTEKFEGAKVLSTISIGGEVSSELINKGLLAVALTMVMIGIYIWLRFEWQFSLGAIVALAHDVALTMGLFAILQLPFDLNIVAAILTIIGYSLNDTVVVYDRIRENLRRFKTMEISDLIDLSINETLRRTTMTAMTTFLALLGLVIFGGAILRGFSIAMLWGVIVGTYSSIFIAAPVLIYFKVKGGDENPDPSDLMKSFSDVDA